MKILGISGSLRADSFNTALLRIAQKVAPAGMEIEIADIKAFPVYDEDIYVNGFPDAVATFRAQIAAADGFLFATPEYNYGMSGVIKNAIDWASRPPEQPFDGKAMAMLGASAGKLGTALAQQQLRQVLVGLNGQIATKPQVFIGGAFQAFDENGALLDDTANGLIGQLLVSLQELCQRTAAA
ncbi:MAG: NAD(P)H-dependent oxidoreductase [Alphaproteobacteria bacterium]|jgi:chromate reductase|nr:NAD(P)H-dependent oxidoreductase [Alphaproteobacteria bacterium]